jgi:deazaflavin-dependent oxidoreductase (nitroreductase family)
VSHVRDGGLWLLKNTLNRVTSAVARSGHGPFSLVEHVGRKSGKIYQTPIIVARITDGFIAELTYGENVNWYRNIEAAGGCELIVAGARHHVVAIERCSPDVGRTAFGVPARQILSLLHRNEFRLLRTARGQG